MSNRDFFEKQTHHSEIKTEIVRKYFGAWSGIMANRSSRMGTTKIGYADLFAGRGRYEDGSKSTPIRILESAIRSEKIRSMLVTVFNDADRKKAAALKKEIADIPGIELLTHYPRVISSAINDSLADKLENITTIPTLYFLDPWGYKDLSLRLIKAVLKPAGCDCIFFFNYNRINAAFSNPEMRHNIDSFFGTERADRLRNTLVGMSPKQREAFIISELKIALKEHGGTYSVEYFFKDQTGKRTSHFLILTSKVALAEIKMKEIMAKESSSDDRGFASFGYNPLDARSEPQGMLFAPDPRDDLGELLMLAFAGKVMTLSEIYRLHSIGRPFTLNNYKDAVNRLEFQGKVLTDPPAEERVRGGKLTFSDRVKVIFRSAKEF